MTSDLITYTLLDGNDALRSFYVIAKGLTYEAALARATRRMPDPTRYRSFAWVAIIPDGGSISDAVHTIRGTA